MLTIQIVKEFGVRKNKKMEKKYIDKENGIEIPNKLLTELNLKKGDLLKIEINKNKDIVLSKY